MERVQVITQVTSAPPYPGPPLVDSGASYPHSSYLPSSYLPQPVFQSGPQIVVQQAPPQLQIVQPVSQVVVVQQQPGEAPGSIKCPYCHNSVVTRIMYKNGAFTWLICATLGILLLWPFCIIPFFLDSCKDVAHCCPSCNNVIHIHRCM